MARASHYEDTRDQILEAIQAAALKHARPPSVRDLAETYDVGVATMHSYLGRLADEGMVEWSKGKHRSLHLTEAGSKSLAAL